VIFALGFRPFFLVAAIFGVVLMAQWVITFVENREFANYYGAIGWHSHEMIFGYTVAVIAGFLLTAVRNWTDIQTAAGVPLAGLTALWFAARLLPFLPGAFPPWLIAAVDIAFLPALAAALAIPLLRSGQRRNLIFLILLGALTLANFLIHIELMGYIPNTARTGTFLGLNLIVLLIVIMGGRVIPFFTERALSDVTAKRWPVIEWLSPASALSFLIAELLLPNSMIAGGLAALAAVCNGIRVIGWYTNRFWSVPLLWVLHLGYAWIVVGFCLKALAPMGLMPPQFALHAFTVGGIGVLTLGMMARVSLGHTGRPLKVSTPVALAFVLINLAAVLRGILPIAFPQWLAQLVALSGSLWVAAFAIFLVIYAPILTQPRIDGRPG
ncbi:MAG: NnrS family protein, partial [Candidatus Binatia bacterium]